MQATDATVDADEIDKFAAHSDWWDSEGGFWALHRLNPTRLGFIRSRLLTHFQRDPSSLRPFTGLRLLDVGCGGGLIAEPMSRLGFSVTGLDPTPQAVSAAREHAHAAGLDIHYGNESVDRIADAGERFDVVLTLEVVEHVADRELFLRSLSRLMPPGAALIAATINRTARSFASAIVGAEYILGWLPRGTHDWRRFVRPSELTLEMRRNGVRVTEIAGLTYYPGLGKWALTQDIEVNYMVLATRR